MFFDNGRIVLTSCRFVLQEWHLPLKIDICSATTDNSEGLVQRIFNRDKIQDYSLTPDLMYTGLAKNGPILSVVYNLTLQHSKCQSYS